ncbi:methyltransferase family protein [Paraburkholderia rhizosphaerae]|uniref:Protein-S-isoprenylcysteine O-methyltransferase Ste14 n=1 Tax=Paraburkholderia rhizosphaerae TaxID=480658 RepID=A0A4V3HEA5_9BURK|nr:isoprenylcysteine carboxylmethyltransferase family protein [Paraburkholderia rhizosphaerae]TDY45465.1 protein-S-isoprenylcysteine O-methyltransferase Ste14 [Paraburkholderia rhizosphaerae]
MIARLVIQTIVWLAIMGGLLFAAAGTLAWPAAWLFLLEVGVLGIGAGVWLARRDPALLAERLSLFVQPAQTRWDKIFMASAGVSWLAWLVLMGIDGARLHRDAMPLWLNAGGALAIVICIVATCAVFRANSYAAPVIKIQAERGHTVSDTGPYAYVRHPMYSAAILFLVGLPLMLGSWWGLACVPLLIAGLGYRAVLEERTLMTGLDGYANYAARVRYRFVPHVW